MSCQLGPQGFHVFVVVGRVVRFGQADVGVDVADFADTDDGITRFGQIGEDHFPLGQTAVITAVASADEMALGPDERPGDDAPYFIRADADFAARNVADAVQFFQGDDVVVGGNLEDAVCRRVDDGQARAEMFRPQAFDDFRARRDFIADVAVARLFRKGFQQVRREGIGEGREGIFHGVAHEFPMAAGRILAGRDFLHEAIRADDIGRFRMDMGDAAQTQAAQIRHLQGYIGVDVTIRVGSFVAEFFGIRCIAGADAVRDDDDDAIEFHRVPSL